MTRKRSMISISILVLAVLCGTIALKPRLSILKTPSNLKYTKASPSTLEAEFTILYYDNYNYDTDSWESWDNEDIYRFWNDEYLVDFTSGKTESTIHYMTSVSVLDFRGSFWSLDDHGEEEDWNPLKSIGDTVSGMSSYHVFASVFIGWVYFEEGDTLTLESDDDAYIFLDDQIDWGQEILAEPGVHPFYSESIMISAELSGYHLMTVKFAERCDTGSGIVIKLNDSPIQAVSPVPCVFITPFNQQGFAFQGETATYSLSVINMIGVDDSFDLSVSGNVWPTSLSMDNTGTIPDGDSVTFNVEVEIPSFASPGDTDTVTITTTSVTDPTMTDTATVTTSFVVKPDLLVYHFDENTGSTAYDSLDNEIHGTIHGATWIDGLSGSALSFDGIDDYVEIPSLLTFSEITFSAWIKIEDVYINNHRIFTIDDGEDPGYHYFSIEGTSMQTITVYIDGVEFLDFEYQINPFLWTHIAVTYDCTNAKIYKDGVLVETGVKSASPRTGILYIGGVDSPNYGAQIWEGIIDEVSIYNRVLTANEIKELYREHAPPIERVHDVKAISQIVYDEERFHFRAWIDGSDWVYIQGNEVWYVHRDWQFSGIHPPCITGEDVDPCPQARPTFINGDPWYPEWPDDWGYDDNGQRSLNTYTNLDPILNNVASLSVIEARGSATIVQYPSNENDYTTIVLLDDDSWGGASMYEFELRSPLKVEPGEPIEIEVTVKNRGDFRESFDVSCYYDGKKIDTKRVEDLVPDKSKNLTFEWDTEDVSVNEYLIRAWADSGEEIEESDEENNWYRNDVPVFVIPEVPLGTLTALISTIAALILFARRSLFKN